MGEECLQVAHSYTLTVTLRKSPVRGDLLSYHAHEVWHQEIGKIWVRDTKSLDALILISNR